MLDLRSPMIIGAAPIGLALGALAWVVLGGEKPLMAPIQSMEAAFSTLETRRPRTLEPDLTAQLATSSLFAWGGMAASQADVPVRVVGIARTPTGGAALLSVNDGPAEWLAVGASEGGVTLLRVDAAKVVIDTPGGSSEVELGESSKPKAPPVQPPGSAAGQSAVSGSRTLPQSAGAPVGRF